MKKIIEFNGHRISIYEPNSEEDDYELPIYFCGDDYYGYYDLEGFREVVKEINEFLKLCEEHLCKKS